MKAKGWRHASTMCQAVQYFAVVFSIARTKQKYKAASKGRVLM